MRRSLSITCLPGSLQEPPCRGRRKESQPTPPYVGAYRPSSSSLPPTPAREDARPTGFMAREQVQKEQVAFHEPPREFNKTGNVKERTLIAGLVKFPGEFMAPMRGWQTVGATHEASGGASVLASRVRRSTAREYVPTTNRFKASGQVKRAGQGASDTSGGPEVAFGAVFDIPESVSEASGSDSAITRTPSVITEIISVITKAIPVIPEIHSVTTEVMSVITESVFVITEWAPVITESTSAITAAVPVITERASVTSGIDSEASAATSEPSAAALGITATVPTFPAIARAKHFGARRPPAALGRTLGSSQRRPSSPPVPRRWMAATLSNADVLCQAPRAKQVCRPGFTLPGLLPSESQTANPRVLLHFPSSILHSPVL